MYIVCARIEMGRYVKLGHCEKATNFKKIPLFMTVMSKGTDYGHPERAFFQKFESFGLG